MLLTSFSENSVFEMTSFAIEKTFSPLQLTLILGPTTIDIKAKWKSNQTNT